MSYREDPFDYWRRAKNQQQGSSPAGAVLMVMVRWVEGEVSGNGMSRRRGMMMPERSFDLMPHVRFGPGVVILYARASAPIFPSNLWALALSRHRWGPRQGPR
jgi:hypothetical protein